MLRKKKIHIVFLVCLVLLLQGCVKEDLKVSKGIEQTYVNEEGAEMNVKSYTYEIKEIPSKVKEQNIYGVAYIPDTKDKVPLVIFAHELCSTHKSGEGYAKELATRGIAVYTFDFRGGSEESRSDGSTVEMSVMSEADDIDAVIQEVTKWNFVDTERIILMGASQGGMASAISGTRNQSKLSGLILLYPALLVRDEIHELFEELENVPEQFNFKQWITLGRNYATDVWDYDVYEDMKAFEKPVLILHGDQDMVVDISYSDHASKTYPYAELYVLSGGGHVFRGESFQEAVHYIAEYLQKLQFFI